MWNTHKVGVTADNIVKYTASSLTVLHTLWLSSRWSFAEKTFCEAKPDVVLKILLKIGCFTPILLGGGGGKVD